jgi:phage FluMu protein Com
VWSNSTPHTFYEEDCPSFYRNILPLIPLYFDQLENLPMEGFSKKAYNSILNNNRVLTKIEIQRGSSLMRPIWWKITNYDLSPEVRDFWWQVTHGVINTKSRLSRFKITQDDKCPRCELYQETTEHCLFTCKSNELALKALYAFFPNLKKNTTQNLLDLTTHYGTNIPHQNAIVLGEYLYTTWVVRNQVVFQGVCPNPKNHKSLFLHRLRVRLKADFFRLPETKFLDRWANGDLPITTNQSKILYIGF